MERLPDAEKEYDGERQRFLTAAGREENDWEPMAHPPHRDGPVWKSTTEFGAPKYCRFGSKLDRGDFSRSPLASNET